MSSNPTHQLRCRRQTATPSRSDAAGDHARILTAPALGFRGRPASPLRSASAQLLRARETHARPVSMPANCRIFSPKPHRSANRTGRWRRFRPALLDRRVEITGPVDRKMIINALNSGAKVFMADFEDSTSPTWDNLIDGQVNLGDAVAGTIDYRSPEGREYTLKPGSGRADGAPARLASAEKHVLVDGAAVSAVRCSISACSFSTTQTRCRRANAGRICICRNCKAIARRRCGTT